MNRMETTHYLLIVTNGVLESEPILFEDWETRARAAVRIGRGPDRQDRETYALNIVHRFTDGGYATYSPDCWVEEYPPLTTITPFNDGYIEDPDVFPDIPWED